MKKKVLSTLSVVLVLGMAALGILAYLTSTDSDVNVMTLGNVEIEQIEQERGDNGELKDFTSKWDSDDKKPLYPAVYTGNSIPWEDSSDWVEPGNEAWKVVENNSNVIDKFVTVKNTGKSEAYVRTLFAIEVGDDEAASDFIHIVVNNNGFVTWEWVQDAEGKDVVIDVDGATYQVAVATYTQAVAPNVETIPSLKQVYLDKAADNDVVKALGDDYRILAISQGVQAQGFADAKTALDTAFGDVAENAYGWFNSLDTSNCIKIGEQKYGTLQAAVDAANENEVIEIIGPYAETDENGNGITVFIPNGKSIKITGKNGATLTRAEGFTDTMFSVGEGSTLALEKVTVDGGAVWSGARSSGVTPTSVNTGVVATGNLVATSGNGNIILNEDAILQNNDGANAVSLATRGGGSLTVNGAQIINNRSAAGAIWGGGNITINEGSKINGNCATSIGGAIRMVDGKNNITFTMNGGEMNYNTSAGTGGAIWGGNNATYIFNGGEMAYNSAATAGGAIWTGTYESYTITGDFKLHDNSAAELGGAIRFCDHASLTMTGGSVYGNTVNGVSSAFYLNNNSATLTGGSISDNFSYSGGLGLTAGKADIDGVISFSLNTNHNTVYLAEEFDGFKFTVNESASNFSQFNIKPAAGYTYTAGDEAKLVCMNEGYETYWTDSVFKIRAK